MRALLVITLLPGLFGCDKAAVPATAAPAPTRVAGVSPAPAPAPSPGAEVPPPLPPRALPAPAHEALVAAEEVAARRPSLLVVDVRAPQAFARGHVAGAQSLKLHALKVSGAVRARETVIVSDGFGPPGLTEVVDSLRAQGAAVRVLDGGFAAWCRGGHPVDGSCDGAAAISPRTLEVALTCPDRPVLVLAEDAATQAQAQALLPTAVVVTNAAQVPQAARAALGEDGRVLTVIGVAPQTLDSVGAHVFEVDGGLAAVAAYRESRLAMLNRTTMVSQGRRAVATGQPTADVVRGEKGCGCM